MVVNGEELNTSSANSAGILPIKFTTGTHKAVDYQDVPVDKSLDIEKSLKKSRWYWENLKTDHGADSGATSMEGLDYRTIRFLGVAAKRKKNLSLSMMVFKKMVSSK